MLPLMLAACGDARDGIFFAAGPVAEAQRAHFFYILGWMAVAILPIFVALPFVLWRYRYGRGRGRYAPEWESQRLLETVFWAVPVVIVVALGVMLWRQTIRLDPYMPLGPDPMTVEVVAMDWKFLFLYPEEGVASVNTLTVPAGRPLRFVLTSATVMQSFVVPRLGGQIYAMGGMVTELNLQADAPGVFRGQNTQYNGEGFAQQKFEMTAMAPDAFDAWLARTRADAPPLTPEVWQSLDTRATADPAVYSAYPPGLFGRVVDTTLGTGSHHGGAGQ
ncbi:cytochrome c oxidase subunit II [Mesobaculum littorinae]|nr:cytochrome ubiquinol oxidase subunit II [Mesobaculum littorinae]